MNRKEGGKIGETKGKCQEGKEDNREAEERERREMERVSINHHYLTTRNN